MVVVVGASIALKGFDWQRERHHLEEGGAQDLELVVMEEDQAAVP